MSIDVEACYTRYGPMVLRRCRKLLRNEEDALDAMQETFVKLVRKREDLEDRGLSSLLYTMATRVCLNRLRSARRRPEDHDDELVMNIAATIDIEARSSARNALLRIFERHKASTQTIAVLHLLDGMTLKETAAAVDMSVSGVRKRLRKLRRKAKAMDLEI